MRSGYKLLLWVCVLGIGVNQGVEVAMAVEEPVFKVMRKDGDISVREYPPLIVAETRVEGAYDDVSNEGFRRLAGYIFCANEASQKIAMTAPVGLERPTSQKIAMTAPVGLERADETSWLVSFTMPAEFTLKTLPKPKDSRVMLREIPAKKMGAYEYSGTWSKDRFEERKQKLLAWLSTNGFKVEGEAVFARYNPPWIPWFLRRNEVLIPVSGK
jgi:hypothetical protein